MSARRHDDLILACVAVGLLLGGVAFLKVVLSPLVAAFVAGLGMGGLGVAAVMRLASHGDKRSGA